MNFVKYQATGNDFVMINGDKEAFDPSDYDRVKKICDRRFGIGADGFIIIRSHQDSDFDMLYYNADGRTGSLCGNGSRCTVAYAHIEGFFTGNTCQFMAYDGLHEAIYQEGRGDVELKMMDVSEVEHGKGMVLLDTGSPHYVTLVEELSDLDIVEAGRAIRYSPRFTREGVNVNFVQPVEENRLEVATYERGVEDETFSCGTGVTACALGYTVLNGGEWDGKHEISIHTKGGELKVRFEKMDGHFHDIWLVGPAVKVFEGVFNGKW